MKHLAVFPSNVVARWIDAEMLERERGLIREPPRAAVSRYSDMRIGRRQSSWAAPGLRYRPFEGLFALRFQRMW
jgi:hypothetical protein